MTEMTPAQALEQLMRLACVQKLAATEVKQNLSDNNYRLLDLARNETDFAGIAAVIEQLQAENDELKSRMPATAFCEKLCIAVGECISDQSNGFDVLASSSWDRVVEVWNEEKSRNGGCNE